MRSINNITHLNITCWKGLLAGLWEFPGLLVEGENSEVQQKRALCAELRTILGTHLTESLFQYVGEVSSNVNALQHFTPLTSSLFVQPLSLTHFAGGSHLLPHPPDLCGSQRVFEGQWHTNADGQRAVAHQIRPAGSCRIHRSEKGLCIVHMQRVDGC